MHFNERDQLLFDQFEETWTTDPEVAAHARNNTIDNFRLVFDRMFMGTVVGRMDDNEAIRRWWYSMGQPRFPDATTLLITADAGGSNGHRVKLWKVELAKLAAETGLAITVCHYPPGTSVWMALQRIYEAGIKASQPAPAAPVGRGSGNRPSKAGVVDLGGLQCGAIGRVPVARRRYRVDLPAPWVLSRSRRMFSR